MKIYVGGVSGVGKTTILNAFSERYEVPIAHGTLGFMEFLGIEGDYQRLRALPDDFREEQLHAWMESVSKRDEDFCLDSHYLIMVNGVVKPVLDSWIGNYNGIVYIETSFDILKSRIKNDDKNRSLYIPNSTEAEQDYQLKKFLLQSRAVFSHIATQYDIPSIVIENNNKNIDDVVKELLLFWKQLDGRVQSK